VSAPRAQRNSRPDADPTAHFSRSTHSTPNLSVPGGGINLTFTDGASGPVGFTVGTRAIATLDGNNTFTGGVTIDAQSEFIANSPNAHGPGGVTFSGQFGTLVVGQNGLSMPIKNFLPLDLIRVDAPTSAPPRSIVHVDANGILTLGGATLHFADLAMSTCWPTK